MAASHVVKLTARSFTTTDRDDRPCVVVATYAGSTFLGVHVATVTAEGDLHA